MCTRGQATYDNLSQSFQVVEIASLHTGKILVPIGIPGLTIIMGNLILPPFHWPWSSSYGSSKQLLSYTSLMGPIYQCVVNTVQYLLNKANNGQSFIDIDGAMILEPCLYLITFPDLPIWCYFPFP
jgi:hypothetical protein